MGQQRSHDSQNRKATGQGMSQANRNQEKRGPADDRRTTEEDLANEGIRHRPGENPRAEDRPK